MMCINTSQNLAGATPHGCSLTVHYVPDLLNDISDISRPLASQQRSQGMPVMSSSRESSGNKSWQDGGIGRRHGEFRGTGGVFRGFGRPARRNFWTGASEQPSNPEPALGSLLKTLNQADFAKAAVKYEPDSRITDCMTVTSYNWLDRAKPTIIVPGKSDFSFDPFLADESRQTCEVDPAG